VGFIPCVPVHKLNADDFEESDPGLAGLTLIADDYAMTAAVSRGILRLLEHGRISGTGAMTNRVHWKGWSHALRGFSGQADLGVHLNLTLGKPLTTMATFAPGGVLPAIGTIAKGALSLRLPREELMAEIEAQLEAFEQAMDIRPDFVDGHQHVHGLPVMRRALLDVLVKRYPTGPRPWLRDPADQLRRIAKRGRNGQKAITVASLATGFGRAARKAGFVTNDSFAGFSAFDPKSDYAAEFATYLMEPGQRHLVMCHPGEVDDELRRVDTVVETRPQELAFLLGEPMSAMLAQHNMRLQRLRPLAS
jgi:chitin disaccharide deacetylase